jgi:TolB-like protein/class 3 adenylate cyclase
VIVAVRREVFEKNLISVSESRHFVDLWGHMSDARFRSRQMRFLFGDCSLDAARRELCRAGETVHVEPQVFDLLLHLVQNRDRVVSKDDLLAAVWQGRIVSESTLSNRINAARRAIGDSGEQQQFIRTVARRGLRFVGAVKQEAVAEQGRTAAILAADAAGFSALMERNEENCIRTLAEYRDVIASFVGAHRGRVFGHSGDEFMAEFQSAMNALRAAVDIQQELSARNAPLADAERLQFRIGINVGNIAVADNTLLGTAVNIAARLQAAADPGGICISADVYEQVAGKTDLRFIDLGYLSLKNLSKPVRAYRIEGNAPTAVAGLPGRRGKPTVAVMPFNNMSGDPEQEYFSDGTTEDIITALSRHRSLLVIARNSTFAFKGHGTDVRRIGIDLGADYIVEGSVRRMDRRLRVTVQLIETEGGRQVWAERYDRNLEDIFEVQDDITATIVARIEPEVGTAERLRAERKPPQALHAWDFFHLGTKHFYRATPEDNREAQRLFQRAIELDPSLAEAYAWLSYAIVLSMVYFDADVDDGRLNEALAIAMKGVELDDQDALTHCMLGRALLARRAYRDALAELESAAELNPSLAIVHCGLGDSLAYEGRFSEAIPYFEKAIKLSPFDPQRWAFYSYRALAHLFAREFDQAVEWAQKATRIPNCHYWPFVHRVSALGHLQRTDELPIAIAELLQRKPDLTCGLARQRLFYVKNPIHLDLYIEGLRRAGMPE